MREIGGGKIKEWQLVMVLFGLLTLVVGLAVAISIVSLRGDDVKDVEDDSDLTATEDYEQFLIDNDKSYQISLEISNVYNGSGDDDGDKMKALKMYDEELSKALSEQDYDLYIDLIAARSTMLNLDGTCEELMAQYDNTNADVVPEEYRNIIYENAIIDSEKCNDAEREAYWRGKADEK